MLVVMVPYGVFGNHLVMSFSNSHYDFIVSRNGIVVHDDVETVIGVREGPELKPLPLVPMTARAMIVPTSTRPNTPSILLTRRHH